jgi:hydroxymethylglutaryl-CoA lyase
MSDPVRLFEVCLRDGLQNEPVSIPTQVKLRIFEQLIAAGCRDIEITSFVRPRMVPQLADASEFIRLAPRVEGVRYWALVPNRKGMNRALEAGVDNIATFLSASETHNKKNVNRTVRESLADQTRIIHSAVSEGLQVRAYISAVFGCPYEGSVRPERALELSLALLEAGAHCIAIGDTIGSGDPEQVRRTVELLVEGGVPIEQLALHFHDTQGMAVANAYAAWQVGVRQFDGSVAGIGGCPYAPGATGNAASEDLIHLFQRIGSDPGIDLDALLDASEILTQSLGRSLPGRVHRYRRAQRLRRSA